MFRPWTSDSCFACCAHRRRGASPLASVWQRMMAGFLGLLLVGTAAARAQRSGDAAAARPDEPRVIVDDATAKVIDAALRFLVARQAEDGSWSVNNGNHKAAITAYVLHAFLASGHLPGRDGKYRKAIDAGTSFLIGCVRDDGYVAAATGDSNMYGHGIATIVLGELYGQAADDRLGPAVSRAVQLIVSAQSDSGGWHYRPTPGDADISITVLQVVALRVAREAGIGVPQSTLDRAVAYIKECYVPAAGGFAYKARGQDAGFARTAAAVYSLQVCGLYDDPLVAVGINYLVENSNKERKWWTYGHFYAAPAQYMRGGERWAQWYADVREQLLVRAKHDGEFVWWEKDDDGGVNEIYITAAHASILAVPLAYLPMYQR